VRVRFLVAGCLTALCVVPAAASEQVPGASSSSRNATGALFTGNFESGSTKPWIAQAANFGYADTAHAHFGDVNVEERLVGQGRFAGRFTLPAWPGGRTRSQLITPRTINIGGDDYYTLMFYLPPGWTPGTNSFWGVSIAELNFQSLGHGGPTVAVQAHSDHVTLAVQSGVATTTFPYFQYRSNADAVVGPNLPPLYAVPRPMKLGVWHELVIHCHWATDDTGVIQVWHRVKGKATWRQTASLVGYPTLQTTPDGRYKLQTLDDIQAYRGPSTAPVTVWLDAFARWGTLAEAQASLPGPSPGH
jgi:Polysaccharide lyase